MDFVIDLELIYVIAWVVIFFVAVLIELLEPQLVSLWFAGGALVALLASTLFNANIIVQGVLFIVSTGVLLYLTKPFVKKVVNNKSIPTNADSLIGTTILVEKGFSSTTFGMGMHGDVRWKLVTKQDVTFKVGDYALIKNIDGNKLIVTKKEG